MTDVSTSREEAGAARAALRVISGGQTGVDRGALDAALAAGAEAGGWCPHGRIAEDGRIADRYPLRETESSDPAERTRLNVRDADATLVVTPARPRGGTALAAAMATQLGRPLLLVNPWDPSSVENVARWIGEHGVQTLNVAGPRASEWPEGYDVALGVVSALLRRLAEPEART
jgi:hypothetical protein